MEGRIFGFTCDRILVFENNLLKSLVSDILKGVGPEGEGEESCIPTI